MDFALELILILLYTTSLSTMSLVFVYYLVVRFKKESFIKKDFIISVNRVFNDFSIFILFYIAVIIIVFFSFTLSSYLNLLINTEQIKIFFNKDSVGLSTLLIISIPLLINKLTKKINYIFITLTLAFSVGVLLDDFIIIEKINVIDKESFNISKYYSLLVITNCYITFYFIYKLLNEVTKYIPQINNFDNKTKRNINILTSISINCITIQLVDIKTFILFYFVLSLFFSFKAIEAIIRYNTIFSIYIKAKPLRNKSNILMLLLVIASPYLINLWRFFVNPKLVLINQEHFNSFIVSSVCSFFFLMVVMFFYKNGVEKSIEEKILKRLKKGVSLRDYRYLRFVKNKKDESDFFYEIKKNISNKLTQESILFLKILTKEKKISLDMGLSLSFCIKKLMSLNELLISEEIKAVVFELICNEMILNSNKTMFSNISEKDIKTNKYLQAFLIITIDNYKLDSFVVNILKKNLLNKSCFDFIKDECFSYNYNKIKTKNNKENNKKCTDIIEIIKKELETNKKKLNKINDSKEIYLMKKENPKLNLICIVGDLYVFNDNISKEIIVLK